MAFDPASVALPSSRMNARGTRASRAHEPRDYSLTRNLGGNAIMSRTKSTPIGEKFGRWTVTGDAPPRVTPSGQKYRMVRVRCECGTDATVNLSNASRGLTKSCGCLRSEIFTAMKTTHGQTRHSGDGRSAEYRAWAAMKTRCTNQNEDSWQFYGARGITVCDRWANSFETFLADVGPRPSADHSIDRICSNGNYEPSNVKWSTKSEQARNRRGSCDWVLHGVTYSTQREAAEALGIGPSTVMNRCIAKTKWPDCYRRPRIGAKKTPVRRRK